VNANLKANIPLLFLSPLATATLLDHRRDQKVLWPKASTTIHTFCTQQLCRWETMFRSKQKVELLLKEYSEHSQRIFL